mmetsp:Transcript_141094/g.351891  ORF Transcript_141094/g.351891 Transcript_141094/m.351891 type:complete len:244 (-) Transcript_141094:195-926(-)
MPAYRHNDKPSKGCMASGTVAALSGSCAQAPDSPSVGIRCAPQPYRNVIDSAIARWALVVADHGLQPPGPATLRARTRNWRRNARNTPDSSATMPAGTLTEHSQICHGSRGSSRRSLSRGSERKLQGSGSLHTPAEHACQSPALTAPLMDASEVRCCSSQPTKSSAAKLPTTGEAPGVSKASTLKPRMRHEMCTKPLSLPMFGGRQPMCGISGDSGSLGVRKAADHAPGSHQPPCVRRTTRNR